MESTLTTQDTMDTTIITKDTTVRPFSHTHGLGDTKSENIDETCDRVRATRVNSKRGGKRGKKTWGRGKASMPVAVRYDEDGTYTLVMPPDLTPAQQGKMRAKGDQIARRGLTTARLLAELERRRAVKAVESVTD